MRRPRFPLLLAALCGLAAAQESCVASDGGGGSGGGSGGAVCGEQELAVLEALSRELAATRDLVAAAERRVLALEALRVEVARGGVSGGVALGALLDALPERHALDVVPVAAVGVFSDAFLSARHAEAPASPALLREAVAFPFRSHGARQAAGEHGYADGVALLVSLGADGALSVTDMRSGAGVLAAGAALPSEPPAGHDPAVVALAVSRVNLAQPLLYTVSRDGVVRRFNLTVVFFGQRVAGSGVAPPLLPGAPVAPVQVAIQGHSRFELCREPSGGEDGEEAGGAGGGGGGSEPPSHAAAAPAASDGLCAAPVEFARLVEFRRTPTLVACAGGRLRVWRGDVPWSAADVEGGRCPAAIAGNGNLLAWAAGRRAYVAYPARLSEPIAWCEAPPGSLVTSLAWDALSPLQLLAGTDAGDVLVFNTRGKGKAGQPACRVTGKLAAHRAAQVARRAQLQQSPQPPQPPPPAAVATIPGYALVVVGNSLVVFNSTGSYVRPPAFLFAHELERELAPAGRAAPARVFAVQHGENARASTYLIGVETAAGGLVVLDSLLPYQELQPEVNWVRGPIMVLVGAAVFMWQLTKQRGAGQGMRGGAGLGLGLGLGSGLPPGLGGGGPSRGGGDMDAELHNYLKARGLGMGGMGGMGMGGPGGINRRVRTGPPGAMPMPSHFDSGDLDD
jgi:hypothetical protein